MNKRSLILLMSLATAGAYAQGADTGITTSTDPAKAAAVEKHAQELQTQQSREAKSKPAATHSSTKKTTGTKHHTHKSSTKSTSKAASAPKS